MVIRPAALANLYRFTTSRRLHAQREVARRASELVIAPLVLHTARAIDHEENALRMEAELAAASPTMHGADARVFDRQVDRALTGVEMHLDGQVRVYGEEHPIGRDASLVRDELLPDGAIAIITLPFASQHEQVASLLTRAEAPDTAVAAAVQRIPALPAMLAQLRALNASYGVSLQAYDRGRPSREEITEAQAQGQDMLAETVFIIMGHYAGQPERNAERDSLLEPVLRQNEAIRQARRRRRGSDDADPETGDELPGPDPALPGNGSELPAPGAGAAGTPA